MSFTGKEIKIGDKLICHGQNLTARYKQVVVVKRVLKTCVVVQGKNGEHKVRLKCGTLVGSGPFPTTTYRAPEEGEIAQMREQSSRQKAINRIKDSIHRLDLDDLARVERIIRQYRPLVPR